MKEEDTYLYMIQGYSFLFTEYANGFLITLITLSLFLVIVIDVPVLEIESREMLFYFITFILTIVSTILTGRNEINKDTHKIYTNEFLKYYSREAISIFEINNNNMFVYIKNFILLLNAALYILIFKKTISKTRNQSSQKNQMHYISTLVCYYIIYIFKWVFFIIAYYIMSTHDITGNKTFFDYYNIVVCLPSLQGMFCTMVLMNKPLRRYAYIKKYQLIKKYKKNEKKAIENDEEVSIENYQILESLVKYDDFKDHAKNTEINVIALSLFIMMITILSLIMTLRQIYHYFSFKDGNMIIIYIIPALIILIIYYIAIKGVVKSNISNMATFLRIQVIILFIYIGLELCY